MVHYKVLSVALLASLVSCEPPVSGYNYQAPRSYNTPSNSYLPPAQSYNPPSNNYLPPTSFSSGHGFSAPNNGLSAPSHGHSAPGYGSSSPGYGSSAPGHGSNGHNHGHGHEHEVPKSYEFGYAVKDAVSGNDYDRRESSDGNVVRGEYRVQLPDGRTQIVTYHADWQTGFHADVRYEGEARYPEPAQQQGGYNYNAPAKDFQGSLTGFHGNSQSYKPSTAYGPPGYH